jgi:hypothetical protein
MSSEVATSLASYARFGTGAEIPTLLGMTDVFNKAKILPQSDAGLVTH